MNEIFYGENVDLSEGTFNDGVVGEGDALLVDLAIAALVNQFANCFEVGLAMTRSQEKNMVDRANRYIPVCDVWLYQTEHLLGCPCHLDENAVVNLEQSEELKDFSWFWCNLIDTKSAWSILSNAGTKEKRSAPANSDNEVYFRLSRNVEIASCARSPFQTNLLLLLGQVLLHVGFRPLEDDFSFGFRCLWRITVSQIFKESL